jgi:hypothetical protein
MKRGIGNFLGDSEVSLEDLLIVSLEQIIEVDATIRNVLNMPQGYEAHKIGSDWEILENFD